MNLKKGNVIKRSNLNAKPNISKKTPSAARMEAAILQRTLASLKQKGVNQSEIRHLLELRKRANDLSKKAVINGKVINPELRARAAGAWEDFYQLMLRYNLRK